VQHTQATPSPAQLWKDCTEETVTSMQPFDRAVPMEAAGGIVGHLVDFPGHPRLRSALPDYIKGARKMVFVVNAAGNAAHITAAAELMFDVLTDASLASSQVPLLLLAAQVDKPSARTADALRSDMEVALTALKGSRSSMLATGESDLKGVLGRKGAPFKFASDAPIPVQVAAVSAHASAGLPALIDFITQ
jgi:signal recognition particle receptor subunit beta